MGAVASKCRRLVLTPRNSASASILSSLVILVSSVCRNTRLTLGPVAPHVVRLALPLEPRRKPDDAVSALHWHKAARDVQVVAEAGAQRLEIRPARHRHACARQPLLVHDGLHACALPRRLACHASRV